MIIIYNIKKFFLIYYISIYIFISYYMTIDGALCTIFENIGYA